MTGASGTDPATGTATGPLTAVPLTAVPGEGPAVALTFDDGPGPHTPQVLEVLARYGIRATFFVCGTSVRAYPALLREVVDAGHVLGNHTFDHPQAVAGSAPFGHFDELPAPVQSDQLDRTARAVAGALGAPAPVRFFRGPGGRHRGPVTARLAAERGLAVVGWAADTRDWCQPAVADRSVQDDIVRRATGSGVARPIVLLHDAKASAEPEDLLSGYRGNTVAALGRIVEAFGEKGFAFVTPDGATPG